MTTIRSRRLVGPVELAGAVAEELYRVPLGRTATVRSIRVVNVTETPQTVDLCIGAHELGAALLWRAVIPAGAVFGDSLWCVLTQDETLIGYADNADALVITVSGSLLGPPS